MKTSTDRTRLPAVAFCDEAGFGTPRKLDPLLWVAVVCVPRPRLDEVASLRIAKGKRFRTVDRDAVVQLLQGLPPIVGVVGTVHAHHAEIREAYSESWFIGGTRVGGPLVLWTEAVINCFALVVSELHKVGSPCDPIVLYYDDMSVSKAHLEGLQEVTSQSIPAIMRETLDSLPAQQTRILSASRIPTLTLGLTKDAPSGGLMLADFIVSAFRKARQSSREGDLKPLIDTRALMVRDLTEATLLNLRTAKEKPGRQSPSSISTWH